VSLKQYHSNGKLLITGEYLVLRGATALALPLRYGQELRIKPMETSKELLWKTYVGNKLWFEAKFDQELNILHTTLKTVAIHLQKILKTALHFQGVSVQSLSGNEIRSDIDFDINWGFGSSSSLISNIGYWLKINPFQLLFETTNGSGYDIAAARSDKPIIYHLEKEGPQYMNIDFDPSFKDDLFFVYMGKKQKSESSVEKFNQTSVNQKDIDYVSEITKKIVSASTLDEFNALIREHNQIMSSILKQPAPGEDQFSDFEGEIKPLGAWGGDFILVTSKNEKKYVDKYFQSRGLKTIFPYSKLVKS